MPITCLCIGDLHFQDSNIEQVDEFTSKLLPLAQAMDPTFIVVMGDVLHTQEKIYVTPFKRATDFIHALSEIAPVYVLIGNHDYKNSSQFLTDEHPFTALKLWPNTYIVDKVLVHEYDLTIQDNKEEKTTPIHFAFTPFVPTGRFVEALGTEMWETCQCVFAHQEVKGAKMGGKISECSDVWEDEYPLLVSGHIHESHMPQQNVFYTGSAMQHAVADEDKFVFELVFNGAGDWEAKQYDLGLKKKKRVRIAIEDFGTIDLTKFENVILTIEISATSEQVKKFRTSKPYKEFIKKGVRFVFSPIAVSIVPKEKDEPSEEPKKRTFIDALNFLIESESDIVKNEYSNFLKEVLNK